jgi:hypothetical protein
MLAANHAPQHILPYIYPSEQEFNEAGIQIIFLGWFMGDWSLTTNAGYACSNGLRIREEGPGQTGDLYGLSNLDEDWHNMNQMVKYLKFGFGKVTEYVNEGLRAGTMDRPTAIRLVQQYDGKCSPEYILSFCKFIDIDVARFWEHVHASTNRILFDIDGQGNIHPRFVVGSGL